MKTIYYTICITVCCMFFVSACTNDLPVETSGEPDILIMNGYIAADSTDNIIKLSRTGDRIPVAVKNGIIKVSINGTLRETVTPQSTTVITPEKKTTEPTNQYMIHTPIKAGDLVKLEASTTDGKYSAWVEETVPQQMEEIVTVDTVTVLNPFSENLSNYFRLTRYDITIKDRTDEDNFYQLIIDRMFTEYSYSTVYKKFYSITEKESGYIGRNDIVLSDGNPTIDNKNLNLLIPSLENIYGIFDDSRFKNTNYLMTVYDDACTYTRQPQYSVTSYVRIRSINKTAYHYFKALNLYKSDNYSETLSGSMKFPSNVNGGTGIIVFCSETNKIIRMSNADLDKVKEQAGEIYTKR